MPTATLTSKGQVTIPKEVRQQLGIGQGDRLEFVVEDDGSLTVRPLRASVRELAGLLHRPSRRAVTLREMKEAVSELLADDDERIRSGA